MLSDILACIQYMCKYKNVHLFLVCLFICLQSKVLTRKDLGEIFASGGPGIHDAVPLQEAIKMMKGMGGRGKVPQTLRHAAPWR